MTRRRWIADEVRDDAAALVGEHAAHLSRVLRAQVGQQFDIAAGGAVRRGTITAISQDRIEFALGEEVVGPKIMSEPAGGVTLLLSIFKFDRMEWAIEKCTELGVARIVPVIARRTDAHLVAAAAKRHERWQRLARQAAEQSRRATPPEVAAPLKLKDAIHCDGLRIVLAESEEDTTLPETLGKHLPGAEVCLAVGPEGGWTADELKLFCGAGWVAVSLGSTILRAETAAIAAIAITTSVLNDMQRSHSAE